MQKISIKTLARRVRSGECENIPVKDLVEEASGFLNRAVGFGMDGSYKVAAEFFKAAKEDVDFAYGISAELEEKVRCADWFHLTMFHFHSMNATIYLDDKRYYKALEEISAAKAMYGVMMEDFAARNEDRIPDFSDLEGHLFYLTEAEAIAKKGIAEIDQNPDRMVFLQNELDYAVSREMFIYAAKLRDKIKKLKEELVCSPSAFCS